MTTPDSVIAAPVDLPEPQRHIGNLIRRAQQLHLSMWARTVSAETTSAQYSILLVLEGRGEASQRELCDDVDLDRSTVADLVRRLERRGLIARRRADDDARRNVVTPTADGLRERRRLTPLVDELQRQLTAPLAPDEADCLHRGLHRMLDRPDR
ncbi:MarR family winged helix-turn-helix transcriptional regulator [Microbacterium sp.]|uniref:MarR family winged helix-turn-helix transcriptional regulator n=1 Tax=Microbacterium sp. TaxID=51671 RepID=UPI003A906148